MRLAIVVACVAWLGAACGGRAKPVDALHGTGGDDRLVIAAIELRGVSTAHRSAVTAIAAAKLPVGEELTDERYDTAHKAILDHYYELGYVNVQVIWPESLATAKGRTAIALTVDEGPVFTIAKLDVKDVADADRARYVALAGLQPGDTFVRSKLAAWMRAVTDAAPGRPIVVPETSVDLVKNTIELSLVLKNP